MGSKSPSTLTTTTSPPTAVLQNYQADSSLARQTASTPYQPYQGELVAGLNQGQANAIHELHQSYGVANPYLNAGSGYLDNASSGLGGVQNYLQAGSQATAQGQQYAGLAAGLNDPNAYMQYYSPYKRKVIDSTTANLNAMDQVQAQGLASNAIGSGSYGGDRAGIGQADLARQQDLANGQTIAGLQNQAYTSSVSQAQAAAGLYGNLANSADQSAGMYNTLGQTQGQTSAAQGTLAGLAGNLGQTAQSTDIAGASAALQGSTLKQQNAQQQDAAAYGQYQTALQYPFQTTSYLANIDQGLGANSGGSSTSPGASPLSQIVGAGTTGLGILGATGAFGSGGYLTGAGGLFSDERVKEDIQPIGKTFDGQTMYRFRYKGDDTVRTGLMAQDVEKRTPHAVSQGLGGIKAVEYGAATDKAAERGKFARGGVAGIRPRFLDGGSLPYGTTDGLVPGTQPLNFSASGLTNGPLNLTGSQVPQAMPQTAGLGGSRLPVLAAPPAAALQQSPNALAGGSSAMAGSATPSSSGGLGGQGSDSNKWMGVLAAGLGMMGGTSPYASANIGQGGLAGLREYQDLNNADRQNALAQSEVEARKSQMAISQRQADMDAQRLQQQADQFNQQFKVQSANSVSENQARNVQTAASLQTMTPAGILQRDPNNPMSPPKLIPWSQITGSQGGASSPPVTTSTPPGASAPGGAAPSSSPTGQGDPKGISALGNFEPPPNIPVNPMLFNDVGKGIVADNAKKQMEAAQTSYDASQTTKMYLSQMQDDLKQLPSSGFLAAGPGQQQRAQVANTVTTALRTIGIEPDKDTLNAIAAGEDSKKLTGRMGFELAKSLGGREPGFIVQQSVGLNPGTENSPLGAQRLIAGLGAAAQRNIDHYNFLQKWATQTGGDLTGADDYFNRSATPQSYANAAITSTVDPRDIKALQDNAKNPAAAAAIDKKYGNGVSKLIMGQQ